MSNIIKFVRPGAAAPPTKAVVEPKTAKAHMLTKAVWLVLVMVWPVLRWVLSIEVFFQFLRAWWYWDVPGVHAGWTFALHFGVLVALTYFATIYKPASR